MAIMIMNQQAIGGLFQHLPNKKYDIKFIVLE